MQGNKVVLIQVWFGPIPDYFWYHYETTKNIKGFDFLFFTDQNIKLDSQNYKVIQTSVSEVENLLRSRLGSEIKIKSNKKACDLKASFGDIFSEYIKNYEYFGAYDIDTLFGDVHNYTSDLIGKYDIISIADEKFHNRLSGPFLIFRNDDNLKTEYRSQEFIKCFDNPEVECFEEQYLDQKLKDKYKTKFLYSINCETENGGKNTYECYWSGGKIYVEGEEKLLYHFYHKKHTRIDRIGNIIIAKYNKVLLEDFYWVVSFTKNYEGLFHNLLKSIKKYSNRKCIIYSINYDYVLPIGDLSSEQFIIRRINIAEGDKDSRGRDNNIISSKPLINYDVIQHFPNKKFVTIDSDIYFTVNSDDISKYFDVLEYYPLINSHIHEVIYLNNIYPNEEWTSPLQLLLDEMGVVDFVVPRRKTNVVLFDKRSEWFFIEQMEIYQKYKNKKPGILALHDEDTANAILSKYNLKKCLPLVDIEEVNRIDMEVFFKYSYHMTPISDYVVLPKNENEVLFFHGIKSQQHYDSIMKEYGDSVIDCEEICMKYDGLSLVFQKNSFLSTKKIEGSVNFEIYDQYNKLVLRLDNQMIFRYSIFYINNVDLPRGNYTIKIFDSSNKVCLFRDVLKVI
jgi:hypothetical protein